MVENLIQIDYFYWSSERFTLSNQQDAAWVAQADGDSDDARGEERTASNVELPAKSAEEKTWAFHEWHGANRLLLSELQTIHTLSKKYSLNEPGNIFNAKNIIEINSNHSKSCPAFRSARQTEKQLS